MFLSITQTTSVTVDSDISRLVFHSSLLLKGSWPLSPSRHALSFTSPHPHFLPSFPLSKFQLPVQDPTQLPPPLGNPPLNSPQWFLPLICTVLLFISFTTLIRFHSFMLSDAVRHSMYK